MLDRTLSVAPMMDWTDRHFRRFLRLLSPHALLYTEMLTTGAILHGDREHLLKYDASEHPVAIQLGGSCPDDLAQAAKIAEEWGYDEVNLNVGCPSPRVQKGRFGACLLAEPTCVADCVQAMREAVDIPVTVKTRTGVDEHDSYEHLVNFVETVSARGCDVFILHARKAWLEGLSPKENRDVPPLQYDRVAQLKQDFPKLTIILNGGINSVESVEAHLKTFDGVMIGRAAYRDPYLLFLLEKTLYCETASERTRHEMVQAYLPYLRSQLSQGVKLHHLTRHLLGLFQGIPGGKKWRRYLSEHAYQAGAKSDVLLAALEQVS